MLQRGRTATMFAKADSYERFMGRWSRLLAPPLVAFSAARDGDAVLDVGSGTGALSFAFLAAIRVKLITGIDPSPDFVEHATQANEDPRVRFELETHGSSSLLTPRSTAPCQPWC